jgi:ADP-heptose:LPS heptosyltransferase
MHLMRACDGLVGGSTDPVHLAAALGIKSLGFYQSKPAVYRRWAAVGKTVTVMHSDSACTGDKTGRDCACVQIIKPERVAAVVAGWFAV